VVLDGTLIPGACPARKYGSVGDLRIFRASGGIRVIVDQAALWGARSLHAL
jgi:hypothetical protein